MKKRASKTMPEAQGFFFQLEKFLLLLLLPFWWVMHRWVIPLFSFLDSANKQPPLTFHLSGGLVSMRDVRTTAFKGSSHVVEVTKMKRSCHLKVHSLHGEGSPVVSGSASFPVQCHVQPHCSSFSCPSGGEPAAPISISVLFLL